MSKVIRMRMLVYPSLSKLRILLQRSYLESLAKVLTVVASDDEIWEGWVWFLLCPLRYFLSVLN